jgi:hypothetical protein
MADGDPVLISRNNVGSHKTLLTKRPGEAGHEFPNNNVRYRGARFHIQTEDSGVTRPRIITHLFADGGHVIKSIRTDYSEYLERPDRADIVYQMMKDQHKAMALDLRDGFLDRKLDGLLSADEDGPHSDFVAKPQTSSKAAKAGKAAKAAKADASEKRPSRRPSKLKNPSVKASGRPSQAPKSPSQRPSRPPARPRKHTSLVPPRAAPGVAKSKAGRPSPELRTRPSAGNIFGVSHQDSMDDVLLNYLTSNKEPPSGGSK